MFSNTNTPSKNV